MIRSFRCTETEKIFRRQFSRRLLQAIRSAIVSLFFLPAADAADLAEKVQESYRQIDQFQADFVQTTRVEILDRTIEEKGRLVFARPGKFLIHYRGVRERKLISDGKKLWIVHPKEKEVEAIDRLEDVVSQEALAFLGGLGEMTRDFKVLEKGFELILIPKRSGSPFRKLILGIDPKTSLAREVTLFPKSGNTSHYFFIRLHEKISDKLFRYPP